MSQNLSEQEVVRRQKMLALKERGVDPFSSGFKPTHHSQELLNNFGKYNSKAIGIEKLDGGLTKRYWFFEL